MSDHAFLTTPRRLTLCAFAAAGLAMAAPAVPAQAQSYEDQYSYQNGDVTVTAPRHFGRSSTTGAPIELASTSRVVDYSDLDLSTNWGERALRNRVARAAQSACDELDFVNPVAAEDNPPCVQTAIRQAMEQAPVGYYGRD